MLLIFSLSASSKLNASATKDKLMKNYKTPFFIILVVLALCSLTPYSNNTDHWIYDIFSNFPAQYAAVSVFFLAVGIWKRKMLVSLLAGILLILNISVLTDIGASARAAVPEHDLFTVCSANINKLNKDSSKIIKGLTESNADIMLLLEVTEENIEPVNALINNYPYHIINLNITASGTGTVLLSRFPIVTREITKYSEFGNMLVYAVLEINNKKVAFYGAHLPRPTFTAAARARIAQFRSLAKQAANQSIPVIVAGDFNATPYSPIFKEVLKISGLNDSRAGFGWQPSWPTTFPFLWIPIDHILASTEVQVHNRGTGAYTGSDHYPVVAELSIN